MKRIVLQIGIVFCFLVLINQAFAQTASTTAGCSELTVSFTAPQASSYYWVFGDGSVSTLQNPVHAYIQPNTYTAQLFDSEGGTQVGDDIEITVYRPIEFDISADVRTGCAPLEVNFTSTLDIDPGIEVLDIVWTFGDGNSASGANVNYTYTDNGNYTVSLKIITPQSIKCDEPVIFPDYIMLEGEPVTFNLNQSSSCDVPDDFTFTNTTVTDPGSTFFWDFGNGETSTDEGPHTVSYTQEGLFFPSLTITSPGGCESKLERTITLGSPVIQPAYPDTICFGEYVLLNQNTFAQKFEWDFSNADIDLGFSGGPLINVKRPTILFTEPGLQTFTLTATAGGGCATTETLDIYVLKPDAGFTVGPEMACTDPVFIEFLANSDDYVTYTFNNDLFGEGVPVEFSTPNGSVIYQQEDREPYYINRADTLRTQLIVVSSQGCVDTAIVPFVIERPEAFFIPDVVKGCVPFNVNFSDQSFSKFTIESRDWNFGDGNTQSYGTNDTSIVHTYTTPGIHEARLTITDVEGCNDVSREVQIIAIDKDTIPGSPSFGSCPGPICVGDSLEILVSSDQVNLNVHVESDAGRFDHCWREREAVHTFLYPGEYPLNGTVEFLTIYVDSIVTGCVIDVRGTHSEIGYFIDCANPYVVEFTGEESINADIYAWYLEDQLISNAASFDYTFPDRGIYTVYLETRQTDNFSACEAHRDSATIYITDVKAELSISPTACASSGTPLDGSSSIDVAARCHSGYQWEFEDQRPRTTSSPVLNHTLKPGFQEVTLIVEDINGCRDTTSSTTTAYALEADIEADTLICLPSDASLANLSVSDTTIVDYTWDFGSTISNERDPMHQFTELDFDTSYIADTISVILVLTDAIGCQDRDTLVIGTYDISSQLMMDNGPTICENESIVFSATDFTEFGSFLTYDWDFGSNGSSMEDKPSVTFSDPGDHPVNLIYTEDASGCQGRIDTFVTVVPTPVADFITDQDSLEFICFPEQIQFTNTSTAGGNATYLWDFGNGAVSDLVDPIIPFDKGTFDITLIALTPEACADTITKTYTLVGPEGEFTVDKDQVCPGEPITFTLGNTIDVSTYTWDFDDGVQISNQSPVTHSYANNTSIEEFVPILILRSDEFGCDLVLDIPITVSSISDSIIVDSTSTCPGEYSFSNTFENPQSIEWDIDGQIITGTSNPSVFIDSEEDSFTVSLSVTDSRGCMIERSIEVQNQIVDFEDEVILFPNVFSPNGDSNNPTFNIVYNGLLPFEDLEIIEFKVYNRWGELLYDNYNPMTGWDGRYKGIIVPADVYAYYISVAFPGCSTQSKKGNVTVIK